MRLQRIDRPIRITRNRDRDWCWTCWCCPPPARWTTHTAGSWPAVLQAADRHLRLQHPHHDRYDRQHVSESLGRAA